MQNDHTTHNPPPTDTLTPEEEDAWSSMEFAQRIRQRNVAAMAAWEQAGQFVVEHADRLGSISLRQAFERGFLAGYMHARDK